MTITSSKTIVLGDFANTNFGDGGGMPSHFPFCFTKDKPQRVTNDHDKSRHFYFHFADGDLYGAISAGFAVDQAFVVLHMQSRQLKSERGMPIKNVGSLTRFPHAQLRKSEQARTWRTTNDQGNTQTRDKAYAYALRQDLSCPLNRKERSCSLGSLPQDKETF